MPNGDWYAHQMGAMKADGTWSCLRGFLPPTGHGDQLLNAQAHQLQVEIDLLVRDRPGKFSTHDRAIDIGMRRRFLPIKRQAIPSPKMFTRQHLDMNNEPYRIFSSDHGGLNAFCML
ncbi:uncharacterized protein FFNC_15370 [Fusarium fujikuroi]|nr:uncharacterized protein FFNC_15370 [Fusarium fujikuroi]